MAIGLYYIFPVLVSRVYWPPQITSVLYNGIRVYDIQDFLLFRDFSEKKLFFWEIPESQDKCTMEITKSIRLRFVSNFFHFCPK